MSISQLSAPSEDSWLKILNLVPLNEAALKAFNHTHNKLRKHPQGCSSDASEREVTPSTRASSPGEDDHLVLSLSQPPKDPALGFVLGSDPIQCDIIIGSRREGVSGRHFIIAFDEFGKIIMRDISKRGSEVSYNGQPPHHRRMFTWSIPSGYNIVVDIEYRIRFSVEAADHAEDDEQHHSELSRYLEQAREMAPSLDHLVVDTSTTTTAAATPRNGTCEPMQRPVYVLGPKIGAGGFGKVYRVFDATTWQVYAGKTVDSEQMMQKEVNILRSLSHVGAHLYIRCGFTHVLTIFRNISFHLLICSQCPIGHC